MFWKHRHLPPLNTSNSMSILLAPSVIYVFRYNQICFESFIWIKRQSFQECYHLLPFGYKSISQTYLNHIRSSNFPLLRQHQFVTFSCQNKECWPLHMISPIHYLCTYENIEDHESLQAHKPICWDIPKACLFHSGLLGKINYWFLQTVF